MGFDPPVFTSEVESATFCTSEYLFDKIHWKNVQSSSPITGTRGNAICVDEGSVLWTHYQRESSVPGTRGTISCITHSLCTSLASAYTDNFFCIYKLSRRMNEVWCSSACDFMLWMLMQCSSRRGSRNFRQGAKGGGGVRTSQKFWQAKQNKKRTKKKRKEVSVFILH